MLSIEWLGHGASLLVLISLTMTSLESLRWLNLAGAASFAVYGWKIGAAPVAIVNIAIVAINIFFLYRMYTKNDYFQLLVVDPNSKYLKSFVEFYQNDIKKWYPNFSGHVPEEGVAILTLRNMAVAGIFVASRRSEDELEINIDFAVPQYADRKVGRHLYQDRSKWFLENGYRRLVVDESSIRNGEYFRSMGFKKGGHQALNQLAIEVTGTSSK